MLLSSFLIFYFFFHISSSLHMYFSFLITTCEFSCSLCILVSSTSFFSCHAFYSLSYTIRFYFFYVMSFIPYEFFFVYVKWVFILFYDFSFITYAFSSLRTTILAISIRYLLLFTWHFPRYVRYFLFFPYDISYVLSLSFLRPTEHLMSANTA